MSDSLGGLRSALVDRYTIERELGSGGMATVYLASDLKHDRQVAVKVLSPELATVLGAERFLREIKIAAKLTHPHVLPLHDSGEVGSFLYYVMPYVEGESLRGRLRRERQLPIDDALAIVRDVAEALSYAHSRGVVHRDIKPENILLPSQHAVVADFGIARAITEAGGDQLTGTGHVVGTPTYMSPEQASGEPIDGRSDLYSLGCVLYELLAGDPPHTASTPQAMLARKLTQPIPRLSALRDTVPEAVERIAQKTLARMPADRYASALELVTAVDEAQTQERHRERGVDAVQSGASAQSTSAASGDDPPHQGAGIVTNVPLEDVQRFDPKVGQLMDVAAQASLPPTSAPKPSRVLGAGYRAAVGAVFVVVMGVAGILYVGLTRSESMSAIGDPMDATLEGAPVPADSAAAAGQEGPAPGEATAGVERPAEPVPEPAPPETPAPVEVSGVLVLGGNVPRDAVVLVDGEPSDGLRHRLAGGTHRVEIRAEGYEVYRTTFEINAAVTTPLEVELVPLPSQCDRWHSVTYNADGECFDVRPTPTVATLVPLSDEIRTRPSAVTLAIKVGVDGTALVVLVLQGSDDSAFTRLAVEFASQLRYDPAQKDGAPVEEWTQWQFQARPR